MRFLRGSLAGKFTIITSLVLLVTVALFAYITNETLTNAFQREVQTDVETLSEIILHTAHKQMLQGHRDNVYQMMDDVSEHKKIAGIRLFDEKGTVRYSTHRNEVGRNLIQSAGDCLKCHCPAIVENLPIMAAGRRTFRNCSGEELLSVTTPIVNQPACFTADCHVHPPQVATLGILEVQSSLQELGVQANTYRKNILAFALSLLLIIIACLFWLTQDFVVNPVQNLLLHITDVACLQFDGQVSMRSPDEIGDLAKAFNLLTLRLRDVQQEYRQLTETLESRIRERTDEIAKMHTQLLHSEKLASLGELVAGIAHEINNPLAGVLMFATMLANNRSLSPELRNDAQTIVAEARRCAGIVRRLLEFSRKSIPCKEPVSLARIIDDTLNLVEHQATLGNVRVVRCYDQDFPAVLVDPGQIEQVFVNMIVNSCQAMPEGGCLTITLEADYSGNLARTRIADTGLGISPQNLAKIFDPFFTTKQGAGDGLAGTGLGLSVSYGIIENHGGKIFVSSEVNRGTTFTVELPLLPPEPFVAGGAPTTAAVRV